MLEHVNLKSYESLKAQAPTSTIGEGLGGETSAIPGTYMTGVREDLLAPLLEKAIPIGTSPILCILHLLLVAIFQRN